MTTGGDRARRGDGSARTRRKTIYRPATRVGHKEFSRGTEREPAHRTRARHTNVTAPNHADRFAAEAAAERDVEPAAGIESKADHSLRSVRNRRRSSRDGNSSHV